MKVSHLPEGSFRNILAHRRNFPKPTLAELGRLSAARHLHWQRNPDLADLRSMPEFSDICNFVDAVCEFIGIPPINFYWDPLKVYMNGFLTDESNSIILTGDIENIWPGIVNALAGHEFWHGMQGHLDMLTSLKGEIGDAARRISEYQADVFALMVSCFQAIHNLLDVFEVQTHAENKHLTEQESLPLFLGESGTYPGIMRRRIHIIGIEKEESWQELVKHSRNPDKIADIQHAKTPAKYGVYAFNDNDDKKNMFNFVRSSPFNSARFNAASGREM